MKTFESFLPAVAFAALSLSASAQVVQDGYMDNLPLGGLAQRIQTMNQLPGQSLSGAGEWTAATPILEGMVTAVIPGSNGNADYVLDAMTTRYSDGPSDRFVYGGIYGHLTRVGAQDASMLVQGHWSRHGEQSPNGSFAALVFRNDPIHGVEVVGTLQGSISFQDDPSVISPSQSDRPLMVGTMQSAKFQNDQPFISPSSAGLQSAGGFQSDDDAGLEQLIDPRVQIVSVQRTSGNSDASRRLDQDVWDTLDDPGGQQPSEPSGSDYKSKLTKQSQQSKGFQSASDAQLEQSTGSAAASSQSIGADWQQYVGSGSQASNFASDADAELALRPNSRRCFPRAGGHCGTGSSALAGNVVSDLDAELEQGIGSSSSEPNGYKKQKVASNQQFDLADAQAASIASLRLSFRVLD